MRGPARVHFLIVHKYLFDQQRRKEVMGNRAPGFQHDQPGMKSFRRPFAVFHKKVNLFSILDIIYIDNDITNTDGIKGRLP